MSFEKDDISGISVYSVPSPVSSSGDLVLYPFSNPLVKNKEIRIVK